MSPALTLVLTAVLAFMARDEADDQYRFIVGLCDKEMFSRAADEAGTFLERWPKHEKANHARYRLATALFELDRLNDAVPHLRKLLVRPGFEFEAEAAFRLAECELDAKRYDRALSSLQRVQSLGKEYLAGPTTFLMAEASFRKGDYSAAREHYAATLDSAPRGKNARDARYGLAWCAFRLGEHSAALTAIDAFLRRHPNDPLTGELVFLSGECQLEAGRARDALAAYAKVGDGPFLDAALRGQGFALKELERPAEAARAFSRIVERFPQSKFAAESALQGGICRLDAGDAKGAVQLLSSKVAGTAPDLLYWRARAKRTAGDSKGALADVERALGAKPDAALGERLAVARGDLLFDLGRTDDAAKAYGGSKSDYALHAAAVASLNDGRVEDARRLASEFVGRFPDSTYLSAAWIVLGEAQLAAKKLGPATAAFEKAISTDADKKNTVRARTRLGWCKFLGEDAAGATTEFRRAIDAGAAGAERAEALWMLGRSFEIAGDAKSAVTTWSAYRRDHAGAPHHADVLLGLARLQPDAAATRTLEELLQKYPDHVAAADGLFALAERLSAAGKPREAAKRYAALLKHDPEHESAGPARYGLAWSLYGAEQYADAATALQSLLKVRNLTPEVRLAGLELLVFAQRQAGDVDGMIAAFDGFRQSCRDEQRLLDAGRACAETLTAAGRSADADKMLTKIRVKDAGAARALRIERAYLALDRGDGRAAYDQIQALAQKGDADPASAEAAFYVAEALFEAADDARAIPLYAYAARIEGSPVAAKAYYKEGFARMRTEDLEGAARAFGSVGDAHRDSPLWGESQYLRGEMLYRLGRFEDAAKPLAHLRKELPRHETLPKALFRLGLALCQIDRWADGESALTELVRKYPKFDHLAETELWRGRALAALDRARPARQALERVLALDRGVLAARARLDLGRLHFAGGDAERALSEFLKVSVLYSAEAENAEALFLAGRCLERVGDPKKAKTQYQEIVKKFPSSAFADDARERLVELKAF